MAPYQIILLGSSIVVITKALWAKDNKTVAVAFAVFGITLFDVLVDIFKRLPLL